MALFSFKKKGLQLKAFLSGQLISLEDVNDGMFSEKMLGEGIAIEPENNELLAPADGKIMMVMDGSFHAVAMSLSDGTEILIHIGLDTVQMNGDGFTAHVKAEDKVKCGDKLISFDRDKIKAAGYRDVTMLVITEPGKNGSIEFIEPSKVIAGESVISINNK